MMFLTLKALLHFFPLIIIDKCFSFIVIVWKLFPKKILFKKNDSGVAFHMQG